MVMIFKCIAPLSVKLFINIWSDKYEKENFKWNIEISYADFWIFYVGFITTKKTSADIFLTYQTAK